jgi:carboxypeptidase C (cathepsin A)
MSIRPFALMGAFLLGSFGLSSTLIAQAPPAKAEQKVEEKKAPEKAPEPKAKADPAKDGKAPSTKLPPTAVTDGSVIIAGQKVEYKATAGTLPGLDKTGKAKANIFYMAYTRKTGESPATRKLTFCFNGGPGSASAYVHLGFFGPRRVLMNDDGLGAPSPVQLVENETSILDVTDLVFIDPVSTGLSRAENPSEAGLFHGLEEDTQSVGDFIRDYVAKTDRKASPVYVAGESYGTTRAASLASYLQAKGGVKLAGIMLISAVLDFQTIRFGVGNDLPYSLFLPTYTATAFHHGKLDKKWAPDLATAVREAQKFANGSYQEILHKGNLLTDYERLAAAKQIALLTGVSEDFVLRNDLRIEATRFRSELLREQQLVVGRLDSRVSARTGGGRNRGGDTTPTPAPPSTAGAAPAGSGTATPAPDRGTSPGVRFSGGDPSQALLSTLYTDGIRQHLADAMNYKTETRYVLTAQVQPWSYGQSGNNRYANVAPRLRQAMEKDKNLKVLVANGYTDLATPFAGTEYTFAHMGPRSLMDQVTMTYYDAGHMMYAHEPSRKKLREDMVKFMAPAAPASIAK